MISSGFFLPVPLMRATRLARAGSSANNWHRDAFPFQDRLDRVGRLGFIARRIAGIDLEQRGEVGQDLRFQLAPVHRRAILGRRRRGATADNRRAIS